MVEGATTIVWCCVGTVGLVMPTDDIVRPYTSHHMDDTILVDDTGPLEHCTTIGFRIGCGIHIKVEQLGADSQSS